MRSLTLVALVVAIAVLAGPRADSSSVLPVAIADLTTTANAVIVGTATAVVSELVTMGDDGIYSDVTVRRDEAALKGMPAASVVVRVLGGTVVSGGDTYTMYSSDFNGTLPRVGRRAVWFLAADVGGKRLPVGGGAGILELDTDDRVRGNRGLTLAEVRTRITAALP